jgi:uncharacterized protein (DUF1778 family)
MRLRNVLCDRDDAWYPTARVEFNMAMPILKRRSRPVTFRVSAEEHDVLSRACLSSGARSISEFARLAVLQRAKAQQQQQYNLSGDLSSLSAALGDLDNSLRDVSKRIRSVLGDVAAEKGN